MASYEILKTSADQKLKVADHLLSTTYSLVKEPKLLVSVIENLYQALDSAINAVLEYEKELKNIGVYTNSFEGRLEMFRRKVMPKHDLNHDLIDFLLELKSTLEEHKKSSVEFSRKEKFVITDNDYNLKTLSFDDVKKRLVQTKHYIDELFKITKKYDVKAV